MSEFRDHVRELFSGLGGIRLRSMFGGHGVYADGLMFAIIFDESLYLKADDQTVSRFTQRGLAPFVYDRGGRVITLSYYQAPEEVMEDPEAAEEWAHLAMAAALRHRGRGRKGR